MTQSSGVYFLANDAVLDWCHAFLESFRAFNPSTRLVMIPFDERIERISRLADRYRFEIFHDPNAGALEEIGAAYYPGEPTPIHSFRKFGVFWGPLDNFVFIDTDIVVLKNLDPLFGIRQAPEDLYYGDLSTEMVYAEERLRDRMASEYGSVGINTGFFGGCNDFISFADVQRELADIHEDATGFAKTMEQPFMNYCLDKRGAKYISYAQVVPGFSPISFAMHPGLQTRIVDRVPEVLDAIEPGRDVYFVHWAGIRISATMPHARLFLHFGLAQRNLLEKLRFFLGTLVGRDYWLRHLFSLRTKLQDAFGSLGRG